MSTLYADHGRIISGGGVKVVAVPITLGSSAGFSYGTYPSGYTIDNCFICGHYVSYSFGKITGSTCDTFYPVLMNDKPAIYCSYSSYYGLNAVLYLQKL